MKNKTFKKSLSVFLAVLMLMSAWVFFPGMVTFEAAAADSVVTYDVEIVYYNTTKIGNGGNIKYDYYPVNADGTLGSKVTGEILVNSMTSDYSPNKGETVTVKKTCKGFPCNFAITVANYTWGTYEISVKSIKIGKKTVFNDAYTVQDNQTINFDMSKKLDSWNFPDYWTNPVWSNSSTISGTTVQVPTSGSKTVSLSQKATWKDQYEVEWASGTTYTVSGSGVTISQSNNTLTGVTVNSSALTKFGSSKTKNVTVTATASGLNKTQTANITLQAPVALTYENLFNFNDFVYSNSIEAGGGGATASGSSIAYDFDKGTITATTGGGEVFTESNSSAEMYSVPVTAGKEYKLDFDVEYKGNIQTFVFFYNDAGQQVTVPGSSNYFYNKYNDETITFTPPTGATKIGFRFGTYGDAGNYAKYSNIRLYETSRQDIVDYAKTKGINRVVYNYNDLITASSVPDISAMPGYNFDSWLVKDVDNTGDGKWDSLTDYAVGGSMQYNMQGNFVIYSSWKNSVPFDVNYDNLFSFSGWAEKYQGNYADGTIKVDTDAGTIYMKDTSSAGDDFYTNYGNGWYTMAVKPSTEYAFEMDIEGLEGSETAQFFTFYYQNAQGSTAASTAHRGWRPIGSATSSNSEKVDVNGHYSGTFTTPDNCYYLGMRIGTYTDGADMTFKNIAIYEKSNKDVIDSVTNHKVRDVISKDLTLYTPTRTGYTFAGWVDANGKAVDTAAVKGYTSSASIFSTWTINKYTVKFVNAAGTTVSTQTVEHGKTPTVPDENTTANYDSTNHYAYSWPAVSAVAGDVTYTEIKTPTAHSMSSEVTTDATCTADGVRTYTCSGCAYSYTEAIGKTGHTPGAAATCTTAQLCTVCNAVLVDKLGHTEVVDKAVEATCTATGLTEGKHCSVCKEVIVKQETVPASGHNEATKEENRVEATCGADGSYVLVTYCSKCNTEIKREDKTIPATGEHSWNEGVETKAPTCITHGEKTFTCTLCGGTKTEAIPATGNHVYGDWSQFNNGTTHRRTCTADASCTAYEEENHNFNGTVKALDGEDYHQYKCEKCDAYGTSQGMNYKEACFGNGTTFTQISDNDAQHKETCKCGREKNDGHVYGSWYKDPENKTDSQGKMSRECTECNYKQTSDCKYDLIETVNSTCTIQGHKTYECKDCGNGYTEILPLASHTAGEAATCTTAQTCTVCNVELVAKLNHDYKSEVTAPTCTVDGFTTHICSRCNDTYTDTKVDALGHSFTNYVSNNDATCLENGTETAKCDRCDATETREDDESALGHSFTNYVSNNDATCLENGTETAKCDRCDVTDTREDDESALGHIWSDTYTMESDGKDGKHYQTCTRENCSVKNVAVAHTWNNGVENPEADCENTGTMNYTCTAEGCGATYTETVNPDGHSLGEWVDEVLAICNKAGTKGHYECSVCHKCFADDKTTVIDDLTIEIAPNNHNWVKGETVAPTCTAKGYTNYKCSYCDSEKSSDFVDPLGHSFSEVTPYKAPTCTEEGNEAYKSCTACGKFFAENEDAYSAEGKDSADAFTLDIVEDAHSWDEGKITTDPTCTEKGVKTYTCKYNQVHTREEDVDALNHIDENNDGYCDRESCKELICNHEGQGTKLTDDRAATCTENGYTGDTRCAKCNEITAYGSVIPKLGHKDEDKNHACDNGCDVYQGEHIDADKNHTCDYGCSEAIGTCEDKDLDHDCDYGCDKYFGEHVDSDKNHTCDYGCKESIGTCEDKDLDHKCDYGCGKSDFGTHEDKNTDHKCDYGCSVAIGTCEDKDFDHDCDYGCNKVYGTCEDKDLDHDCDYGCDKYFGEHVDSDKNHTCDYGCKVAIGTCADENTDHKCDYGCDKVYGICEDKDLDHKCDYGCDKVYGTCEDTDFDHDCDYGCDKVYGTCEDKDFDHDCDYGCDKVYGTCEDADKDHDCDYGCDKVYGEHEDTDKDHACDYGCKESIGTCEDKDLDHKCDYGCGKSDFGTHEDTDTDHTCDYGCKESIGTCEDKDFDHDCDYGCDKVYGTCEDADKDHDCDYGCDKVYGEHVDVDKNHTCDYGCKVAIGTCEDKDLDHDCDYGCDKVYGTCEDENTDHKCDYGCDKAYGTCEDKDLDHKCDYGCDKVYGTCEDKDLDHDCDYGCDKVYGTCEDKDFDHDCDYGCDKVYGTCEDKDFDHDCDYGCDKYFGEHVDSDKNHTCDYGCKEAIGTCADENTDHKCDYGCDKVYGEHVDSDKNHNCDYGCTDKIGECVDTDKDHACDYGCTAKFGEHVDSDKNHTCDYGCKVAIGTCEDADKDHDCDYGCDKYFGEHVDSDKNHTCDYGCSEAIGTCEDKDFDHDCDYGCDKYFGEHVDSDKNHTCDYGCKVAIGIHADSAEDNDHVCDYGCGAVIEACVDADPVDGKCDVCGADICKHEDYIYYERVEATCKATGNVEYWHCNTCGRNYSDADCKNLLSEIVIPVDANAHTGEANVTKNYKAATCTEKGYTGDIYWSCCDTLKSKGSEIGIDKDAHTTDKTHIDGYKAPTCTTAGATGDEKYDCCNAVKVASVEIPVDANAHTGEANVTKNYKAATCTEKGYTGDIYWSCCDTLKSKGSDIGIDKDAHTTDKTHIDGYKAPTCTTAGATGDEKYDCCNAVKVASKEIPVDADAHTGTADVIKNKKPATCKEEGYTGDIYWSCCDALESKGSEIGIDKDAHITDKTHIDGYKAPTCTTAGATGDEKYDCCNAVKVASVEIPVDADAHTGTADVIKNKKPATCIEKGYTGDTYWSCCDTLKSKGSEIGIDKDAHTTDKTHIDGYKAPTCTTVGATGDEKYDCCNAVKVASVEIPVDANAHTGTADVIKNKKPATCTEEGYTGDIYWSCCDALESKGSEIGIDKDAHTTDKTHIDGYKAPTCTTAGATGDEKYDCCNAVKVASKEIPVDANAHTGTADVIKNKKPATCKEEGYTGDTYWSCCDALESKGQTIEALPHTEATRNENEVAPSCGNDGSYDVVTYCSVCSEVIDRETITVPATGSHNFATVKEKVDATCNTEGYIIRVCGCGAEEKEIIPANDSVHVWETDENGAEKWIISKEPTCVSKGEKICYCTVSEGHYKVEYIEPTGHNYEVAENGVVAPSCMNQGYTKYICSKENCGSVEHRDFVAALGHDLVSVVTAPTCEERGYTENYCNRCTYTYTDSYTEATGHADKNGDGKCDGCKENNVSVCSCACHSTNWFIKLIYKIVRFIWKLLKVNADCRCGAIHY